MAEPQASVIIPTHQRREVLRLALATLSRQTSPPGSFEVIVSIDDCSDGTAEMLSTFDAPYRLEAVSPQRRGRAAACNAAIDVANGQILIILDDDMRVTPEFVEAHLARHQEVSPLCVLGAVPVELNGSSTHAARYVQAKTAAHLAKLGDEAHLRAPRSFYTGNASLGAKTLRKVGGFDESFTAYGNEDVELALRLREAGVRLRYEPRALARQDYGKDLNGLARDTLEKGATTVLLARLHADIFDDLQLASPQEHSRIWLAARAILIRLTRGWPSRMPKGAIAAATLLERLGLWRMPLFYRAVLDYSFWAGVDGELTHSAEVGQLRDLSRQLDRGPLDLLLHG